MKKNFTRLRLLALGMVCSLTISAQNVFWSDVSETSITTTSEARKIIPNKYRTFALDTSALLTLLDAAPLEFTAAAKSNPVILSLPMPDGSVSRFSIIKTAIMEDGLAQKFPYFRTLGGQGIDDPYSTLKIDWTSFGFRVQILSVVTGSIYIEPYSFDSKINYTVFYKKDLSPKGTFTEDAMQETVNSTRVAARTNATCVGGILRTYRIAVACTGEYARAIGGAAVTPAQALSAIVTTINRVDGVYENDLAVRLTLVANNNLLVFTDPATDPFNGNSNPGTLINESQTQITNRIGSSGFDIGHTVSTGGGGLAGLGVVCIGSQKARGITGSPNPSGDAYDIDYVAHEVGHQFAGEHTFNATTGSCGGNGSSSSNAEPGSGVTIMAYAGICAGQNVAPNSIPFFHPISYDQIISFSQVSSGNNCAAQTATGNNPPTVNAGSNYIIPKSTPFELEGSATDPDGDVLTYSWEQTNTGGAFGSWNSPSGNAPLFRTYTPTTSSKRVFPQWSNILNNSTSIGELLPSYARTLNFRLTARDNKASGGGVCSDDVEVTVNGTSGPFTVLSPNTSTVVWEVGTYQDVTWDISGTNAAPVFCDQVTIQLSIDGGFTYPITLVANTANDGSEQVLVPNNITSFARVRVKALGNIFFDVSNLNFKIQAATQSTFVFNNPPTIVSCDNNSASLTLASSSVGGFTSPITLSAQGNPAGTTVTFSSNPINPGDNVTVTLSGTSMPSGLYSFEVIGISGAISQTRMVNFSIGSPTTTPVALTPADQTNGISNTPTFTWQATPGAQSYLLEISTTSDFGNIVQSIPGITGTSYTLTTPLADSTEYYWRLSVANACGAGPASSPFILKTAVNICTTPLSSVAVTIPTSGTRTSTISIPSGSTISDIDVTGFNLQHSYIEDIKATLISPANTRVELFNSVCGGYSGSFKFNFDDAATLGSMPCPPPTSNGVFVKPAQSLSTLNGQNSSGTWTLEIVDQATPDGGTLYGWGLKICALSSVPWPVNWLTFNGRRTEENTIQLNWSTANEVDNVYYDIERSANGTEFTAVGRMKAGNNPGTIQQYIYTDLKPYAGVNYYRLKQVDKDGKFSYSTIVRVITDKKGAGYVMYPNPATDVTTVRMLNDVKDVTIRLHNALGQTVYQKVVGSVKAGQEIRIPANELGKGVYNLTIITADSRSTEKLMIQ